MGTWQHGRHGNDLTIEMPYGTVVRELRQTKQTGDEAEFSASDDNGDLQTDSTIEETWSTWRKRIKREKLSDPESVKERRKKIFVLYPTSDEESEILDSKAMDDLEMTMLEDGKRNVLTSTTKPLFELDFDKKPTLPSLSDEISPETSGAAVESVDKVLLLRGGQGGFGNPYFAMPGSRKAPKVATRGRAGESMRLELELKTLADIGLVGLPNAGKR